MLVENFLVQINGVTKYLFEVKDRFVKYKLLRAFFRFMSKFPTIDFEDTNTKLLAFFEGDEVRCKLSISGY